MITLYINKVLCSYATGVKCTRAGIFNVEKHFKKIYNVRIIKKSQAGYNNYSDKLSVVNFESHRL